MAVLDLKDEFGFGNYDSLGQALNTLLTPVFAIAGLAVMVYFIIGAVRFITSGGDKEAVAGAQKMITHSIIGFILLVVLFLIVKFVLEFLGLGGLGIIR